MARLEYQITGTVSGLQSAATAAQGILNGLKQQADALRIKFFQAEDVTNLNAIGNSLAAVTGKINEYTAAAIKGSQAFQDQSAQAALDQLSTKLNVIAGNALLFGDSLQSQQSEIKAYQAAISSFFAAGLDPLDSKVQALKSKIDSLTASIETQRSALAAAVPTATQSAFDALSSRLNVLQGNAAIFGQSITNSKAQISAYQSAIDALLKSGIDPFDVKIGILKRDIDALTESVNKQKQAAAGDPFARYAQTGNLIQDAERKVRNLGEALRLATDERGIERYNQRLVRAQAELTRLNNLGLTAGQQAQRTAGGYSSLGTELARIGQDAPFAFRALGAGANNFGAIGNNITRLVELIPGYLAQTSAVIVANGGVATSANVAKAALAGLFTGFGALVLGVSLAVSAFTIYSNLSQRAAREAKEQAEAVQKQDNALSDYIKTLSIGQRVSGQAASNYGNEVSKLDSLYTALIKNADARYQNNTALNELQKSWPAEFANLQKGIDFTSQLSSGYRLLRENLVQLGIAQAAQSLSGDANKRLVQSTIAFEDAQKRAAIATKNLQDLIANPGDRGERKIANQAKEFRDQIKAANETISTYRIEIFKARQEVDKLAAISASANSKITSPINKGLQQQLEAEIATLEQRRKFSNDENQIGQLNVQIKEKQAELDKLLGREQKTRVENTQRELSINQQINALKEKIAARVGKSGLEGYAAEVKDIELAYKGLDSSISNIIASIEAKRGKKGGLSNKKADSLIGDLGGVRDSLTPAMNKELANAAIKESQRVSDEITRINNEFGVKSAESKAKELLQIQARYDAEVVKAKGNASILTAIEEGRVQAVKAINDKYAAIAKDYYAKIDDINATSIATITGREETETDRIKKQWRDRREALVKYYDALIKLYSATPGNETLIGRLQIDKGNAVTNADKAEGTAVNNYLNKDFNNALKGVTKSFVSDLQQQLFNASSQAGYSFKSVFTGVVSSFSQTIQNGVFNVLQSQLEKKLQAGIDAGTINLGANLKAAVAGLAIAGGLVSGLTPKTSVIGQGLGGALSGAAAGATIGSVVPGIGTAIGAGIGGLVGLVGGIFGANKAQEELQKQQLAEQKQQTELLRNSVAYTSSIIGRMTTQGIVTGVDVTGFGEITTRISGKDLEVVLQRSRGR